MIWTAPAWIVNRGAWHQPRRKWTGYPGGFNHPLLQSVTKSPPTMCPTVNCVITVRCVLPIILRLVDNVIACFMTSVLDLVNHVRRSHVLVALSSTTVLPSNVHLVSNASMNSHSIMLTNDSLIALFQWARKAHYAPITVRRRIGNHLLKETLYVIQGMVTVRLYEIATEM